MRSLRMSVVALHRHAADQVRRPERRRLRRGAEQRVLGTFRRTAQRVGVS